MKTTTAEQRRLLYDAVTILESLNYPTAAHAVNEALRYDSQEREAIDTFRVDDEEGIAEC
jgi:hypothetical protein